MSEAERPLVLRNAHQAARCFGPLATLGRSAWGAIYMDGDLWVIDVELFAGEFLYYFSAPGLACHARGRGAESVIIGQRLSPGVGEPENLNPYFFRQACLLIEEQGLHVMDLLLFGDSRIRTIRQLEWEHQDGFAGRSRDDRA